MAEYVVKILDAHFITHDVKRFLVEKPASYAYIPGQATDVSVNVPGWEDKLRPFTFTCLQDETYLEFMIKIYTDHKGVTNKLSHVNAGAELILHDVFGAIQYKGMGTFIAAGSGITPFIAIFRDLNKKETLKGNRLIYSNKSVDDVIMGNELKEMLKEDFINIFTRQFNIGFTPRHIDRDYLIEYVSDFAQNFYLCGTDGFVNDISRLLLELGATPESLVFER